MPDEVEFDWQRQQRTGIAEAVMCSGKSFEQLQMILSDANEREHSVLLTRMAPHVMERITAAFTNIELDPQSGTAILNNGLPEPMPCNHLILTAGSSDMPIALEAQQTLKFYGLNVEIVADCGVAGLWRLTDKLERLHQAPVLIAIAGMEGALFSVLAGLVPGLVIAVPSSNGYGVAEGGKAALSSALASCAPGVVTVNINNGFGAACALLKVHQI